MRGLRTSSRHALGLSVILLMVALPAAGARASSIGGGAYTAGPGEANHVTVSYDAGASTLTLSDAGVASITDANPFDGCQVNPVTPNQATCSGNVVASLSDIQLGDGNDSANIASAPGKIGALTPLDGPPQLTVEGGAGSDALVGGPQPDRLLGQEGEDSLDGREGPDQLDLGFSPFTGAPLPFGTNAAAGSDSLDGGPGPAADVISGIEDATEAPDQISCRDGGENPQAGQTWDIAVIGAGDQIDTGCETVTERIACPKGGPACSGLVETQAGAPAAKGKASASAARKGRETVRLGRARFTIGAGSSGLVNVTLVPKNVKRVLRGRTRTKAQDLIRMRQKKRLKTTGRTPFVLTRG